MENLSFGFTLDDKMTSALKSITESLAGTINYLEDVNKSIEGVDKQNFNTLKKNITQACSNIDQLSQGFNEASSKAQGLDKNVDSINGNSLNNLKKSAESATGSIEEVGREFSQSASQATQLNNASLSGISRSAENASKAIADIGNEAVGSAADLNKVNGSGINRIATAADSAAEAVDELGDEASETEAQLSRIDTSTGTLNSSFSNLKSTVLGAVAAFASFETAKAAINLSDEMTQTTSRLNLMNDGMQTTEELQSQIKEAALSSHAEYSTLADTVAKLGNNAGAAFSSSSEIVSFAEQLSKQFAISGASADEMAAATLQLTQGLSSGVLRGDEFNSVMEQAPGIAQMLADYLQVDKSQIRDMAAEGALTADVVKNAILGAANETDQKFDQMKVTFGQLWTDFKTNAMFAFKPISEALSNIANNDQFQSAVKSLGDTLNSIGQSAAPIVESVGNAFVTGFSWLINNWQTIAAGIGAITTAIVSLSAASSITSTFKTLQKGMGALFKSGGEGEKATGVAKLAQSLLGLMTPTNLAIAAFLALGAATAYFIATGKKVSDITKGFNSFDTAVSGFASNFGSVMSGVVESIQAKLPAIASQAGVIMSTLITGLLNSALNLVGAGAQIVLKLIVGIAQTMPTIVSSGFTFITNFLSGLMSGIPRLAETALTVIENFIGSLAENLPTLIQSGADTLVAWCQGLGQALPTLFAQAVVMISGLVQTIGEHLPEIIAKGFELVTSLVTGILQALPSIAQAVLSLIISFGGYIIQNLPMIIQAGINMVGGLVSGLVNSIPALLTGLAQLLSAIIDGIAQAIPGIVSKAWEMGGQLIQGLKNGISEAWSGFTTWLSSKWDELLTNVKSFFGIASPSTVFNDLGSNLLQGFWNGLQSIWEGMSSWIGGVWDQISSTFSGGNEVGGIDFTQANQQLDEFKSKVETVFNEVSQKSLALGQTLTTNIVMGLGSLAGQMAAAFAGVQGAMQAQVAQVVAITVQGFGALVPSITGVFGVVSSQCVTLLNTFSSSVQAVIARMAQLLAGSFSGIATSTIAQFEIIKNSSLSTMQAMISAIEGQFTGFANALLMTFTTLSNNLSLKLGVLVSTFNSGWSKIKNDALSIVSQMCNQILNLINKLVQDITNTMGRLRNEFSQIAKDMMSQFIAGINSQSGAVVSAASNLVQQLKDTFEKGLGIHSPSDYMIWVGQMMLAGLLEGMSPSDITAFIESTIKDMQASFEAGNFNAAETMDFISQQGAIDLIAKVTGMDLSAVTNAPASIPGIIQAAQQHIGYISPGGRSGSKFGLRFGNNADWCVSFVRAMAEDSGVPFPATNYVPDVVAWAKSQGRWTQEPQSGYAVIFDYSGGGSGSHIELVESVRGARDITTIGGNTGSPRGVYRQDRRSSIMGYVALDGGHGVGSTLAATLQNAYNAKYNPMGVTNGVPAYTGDINTLLNSYMGKPINLDVTGSGLENPAWFQRWTPPPAVARWAPQVLTVLRMLGQPETLLKGVLFGIDGESGGDPYSTYLGDENIIYGGSKGLLQTITPNFEQWKNPALPNDIYDPMQNIWCCLREMQDRYGGISNLINRKIRKGEWSGYAVGTRYVPQDMLAMIHKGEAILPASQNPYTNSGGDYLGDMFSNYIQPDYEPESFLNAENYSGTPTYTGTNNNVNVTLNVTQNINDSTDSRKSADEILNYLYDELERQFNGTGGGVALEY